MHAKRPEPKRVRCLTARLRPAALPANVAGKAVACSSFGVQQLYRNCSLYTPKVALGLVPSISSHARAAIEATAPWPPHRRGVDLCGFGLRHSDASRACPAA
jgi:hypothetical protein